MTADSAQVDADLRDRLLQALSAAPDGLSLPRLAKRLGVRMSVLLRTLAWLGDDMIGTQRGAGLVRVEQRGELQVAVLASATATATAKESTLDS